jgi:hypothetical protein
MRRHARDASVGGPRSVGPTIGDAGPTLIRVGTGFRILRGGAAPPGVAPPDHGDEAAYERNPFAGEQDREAPASRDGIRALRDARARLSRAAKGDEQTIDRTLRTLLLVAVAMGFSRATAYAVAAAALEEGFPKLRGRHARARAVRWSARARETYDALTHSP